LPTIHTSHCQYLLLSRRLELTCRHVDTTIRCLTASLSHLPLVCALGHARSLDGHRQTGGWGVRRGQSGKCRIVRQYHVHDYTITGGRCADTLPHLTASISPRLRPLADPTSPVAPHGGNGPIVIVRVRRGQWEKCRVARPCRVREAQGAYWSRRKKWRRECAATSKRERERV
jgi:hypothetical protein